MSKRIVIIGGMGPQASLELHRRIVNAVAKNGAKDGDDFPEIAHVSLPVRAADFINRQNTAAASRLIVQVARSVYIWRRRPSDLSLQHSAFAIA